MIINTKKTKITNDFIILLGRLEDESRKLGSGSNVNAYFDFDNLKPENGSNSIESNIFTFETVPVNASFHSCIPRLISPNVTL